MRRPETRNRGARITEARINGMRNIYMENSLVRLRINLDLGAAITQYVYKPLDVDAMWSTPLPEIPYHGAAGPVRTENGFDFYYEGGWQELFPHASKSIEAYGGYLPTHGEAWGIAWDYRIQKDELDEVVVDMWCYTRVMPFLLFRRVQLREGEGMVTFEERVENLGTEKLSFIWGHHPAYGEPFLEEGCILSAAGKTLYDGKKEYPWPPEKDGVVFSHVPAKGLDREIMVFITDLDEGTYEINNPHKDITFRMNWDKELFPYLWVWQEFGSIKESPWFGRAYAMAIEPMSSLAGARAKGGRMLELAGGGVLETTVQGGFVV